MTAERSYFIKFYQEIVFISFYKIKLIWFYLDALPFLYIQALSYFLQVLRCPESLCVRNSKELLKSIAGNH